MGPSKSPTKAEQQWMDAAREFGCIACFVEGSRRPAVIHHLVNCGRRMGHKFTIGLCQPGHHMDGESVGMLSVHPWKKRFELRYGTEIELLRRLKAELGVTA